MFLHLNSSQLLEYRRQMAGLEPLYLDFTIEQTDGIDIDQLIGARLRRWYLEQLDTAPIALLPVEDVAENVTVEVGAQPDCVRLVMPEAVRRPVSVRMEGWRASANVQSAENYFRVTLLQQNRFTAAHRRFPIAVADPTALNAVYVFPAGLHVNELKAVVDPGDGQYVLDEALLSQLPVEDFFKDL